MSYVKHVKHVALSANGAKNLRRAREYATGFEDAGVAVLWTLPTEVVEGLPYSSGYEHAVLANPDTFRDRRDIIQGAAALVVVTTMDEAFDRSEHLGSSSGVTRWRGIATPQAESQVDMGMALGAGVPVFMPEGYPSLDSLDDTLSNPWASADRLQAMGVLVTPDAVQRQGYIGEHVNCILEVAAHHAGAATTRQPLEAMR